MPAAQISWCLCPDCDLNLAGARFVPSSGDAVNRRHCSLQPAVVRRSLPSNRAKESGPSVGNESQDSPRAFGTPQWFRHDGQTCACAVHCRLHQRRRCYPALRSEARGLGPRTRVSRVFVCTESFCLVRPPPELPRPLYIPFDLHHAAELALHLQ